MKQNCRTRVVRLSDLLKLTAIVICGGLLQCGWAPSAWGQFAGDAATTHATTSASTSRFAAPGESDVEGTESGHALAIARHEDASGARVVQVIEDERMIRISERPGKEVTVIVLETMRDTEKVNRYAAPSVDMLKARHPRGYDLYQRYAHQEPRLPGMGAMAGTEEGLAEGEAFKGLNSKSDGAVPGSINNQARRLQQQMFQQMQQMQRLQQMRAAQQRGLQQSGGAAMRGAWAGASARASASASSSSHGSSSSQQSQSQSSGGR